MQWFCIIPWESFHPSGLRPLGWNNSRGMLQNHCIPPKSRAVTYFFSLFILCDNFPAILIPENLGTYFLALLILLTHFVLFYLFMKQIFLLLRPIRNSLARISLHFWTHVTYFPATKIHLKFFGTEILARLILCDRFSCYSGLFEKLLAQKSLHFWSYVTDFPATQTY